MVGLMSARLYQWRRFSRKKVSFIVAIMLLILSAMALVKMDPAGFVWQRREVEIPETTNIVPDTFSERQLISNESVKTVSQIVVGESVSGSELYSQISQDLSVAIQEKTGIRVDIVNDTTALNNSILIGNSEVNRKTRTLTNSTALNLPSDWGPQSFVVCGANQSGLRFLLVFGNDSLGDAYGVYWLIEQILYGSEASGDLFKINESRSPAVKLRILDASSAFYDPNVKPRSWWGQKLWMEKTDTDEWPYVNETRLAESAIRFREFLNYTLKTGYSGILIQDFWHYVNFDDVVDGAIVRNYTIYSSDGRFRIRHTRYQEYFSDLFNYAKKLNLSVFVYADIPTFTPPLENYLGGSKANVKKIISVCVKAIDEFFTIFSTVDGIVIRTGELGGTHDMKEYYCRVIFDSFDSTRQLLNSLLEVFHKYNKTLFFRIWSIGIGEMGDIHQDPEAYDRLLSEFENEKDLVISIKYVRGDFYRDLPFNPNIGHGKIRQMVEIEAVPEYGGFSMYPNYLVEIFQEFMLHLERIPFGLWVWVQEGAAPKMTGGFGPFTLFLFRGFWSNTDANAYAFGKVAWNPHADVNNVTYTWAMKNFGSNFTVIQNVSRMLLMSDDADVKALYIEDYARKTTYIIGSISFPESQLWIWWDVPQSSSFALAPIYRACKEGKGIEANVQDGFEAVSTVKKMQDCLKEVKPEINEDLLDRWKRSMDYERSYFTVLAYFRECFLYFYEWTETLNSQAASRYRAALENLKEAKSEYETTYNGSDPEQVIVPADLSQIESFIERVENTSSAVTVSRTLFVALSFVMIICVVVDLRKRSPKQKGAGTREQVPSAGTAATRFENLSKALVIVSQMVLHPVKSFKTLGETDRFRLIVYVTSTVMVLALTSTCLAVLNFLVYSWQLFLFLFACLLGLWLFSSTVFTLLATSQSKAARFRQMLEGNAVAITVPLLYLDLALLGLFSIWGPQRMWMFWSDSTVFIFAFYALILAFGWAMYLAVSMVRGITGISRKVSLLIVITSLALLASAVLVSLSALGLDLWSNIVYSLHRVFNIMLSTMFERGPGAGAWVPLTFWDLALASLGVTAVLVCLVLIAALRSKKSLT